jgi:hypothetical protein
MPGTGGQGSGYQLGGRCRKPAGGGGEGEKITNEGTDTPANNNLYTTFIFDLYIIPIRESSVEVILDPGQSRKDLLEVHLKKKDVTQQYNNSTLWLQQYTVYRCNNSVLLSQ